jgi:hypothetical protein
MSVLGGKRTSARVPSIAVLPAGVEFKSSRLNMVGAERHTVVSIIALNHDLSRSEGRIAGADEPSGREAENVSLPKVNLNNLGVDAVFGLAPLVQARPSLDISDTRVLREEALNMVYELLAGRVGSPTIAHPLCIRSYAR